MCQQVLQGKAEYDEEAELDQQRLVGAVARIIAPGSDELNLPEIIASEQKELQQLVDKQAFSFDEVEEEVVSKIQAAMAGGGYIFGVDHSVPNDVPLENFRFAIELVERYGRYG